MLSEEEKKAIQYLNKYCDTDLLYEQRHYNYIKMIIRLVGKQSKEIERLKDKLNKIYNETDNKNSQLVKALNYKLFMEDKIKAKIEEYKESGSVDGTNDILITEMQSLLEKE